MRSRVGLLFGSLRAVASMLAFIAIAALPAAAQRAAGSPGAALAFTVVDESDAAVGGARVLIASEGRTLAVGTTDAAGRLMLAIPVAARAYHYSVRHVGFGPIVDSVLVDGPDTLSLLVRIAHSIASLDTVRSNARLPSSYYALDADEIARNPRHPDDAYDALIHIRPAMLGDKPRMCPYIQNLWVNGEWQFIPPWTPLVPLRGMITTRTDLSGRHPPSGGFPLTHPPSDNPLAGIRAGHVAEMHYVSCWTTSVVGPHGVNALFVTLKPGIGFDPKHGTYVADSAAARAARVIP